MKRKAFTLIELLIVVAIIAILAAIAVPNFLEAQTRAKVSRVKSDMRALATAIESYRVDNNNLFPCDRFRRPGADYESYGYISSLWWLFIEWENSTDGPNTQGCGTWLTSPIAYMTTIPIDPFTYEYAKAVNEPSWGSGVRSASCYYGMRFAGAPLDVRYVPGYSETSYLAHFSAVGYFLDSVGPDLFLSFQLPRATSEWNNKSEPSTFIVIPYDPTNGTVSLGEITYTGGAGFGPQQ